MNTQGAVYHIGANGITSGPFPEAEIRSRLAEGALNGADLCWTDGWPAWKPLAQVFPAVVATLPPPVASAPLAPPPASPRPPPVPVGIEGRNLVVPRDIAFPRVCIRTGATENLMETPIRCLLTWHHPAIYLGILANILVYLVLAIIFRKKSTHLVWLSREARAAQIKWHLVNWGVFIGIWISVGLGVTRESGTFGFMAFACLIATIVIYFTKVRILYATNIDQTHARIGGVPPAVQARLIEAWE